MRWLLGAVLLLIALFMDGATKVNLLFVAFVVLAIQLWQQRSELQALRAALDAVQKRLARAETLLRQASSTTHISDAAADDDKPVDVITTTAAAPAPDTASAPIATSATDMDFDRSPIAATPATITSDETTIDHHTIELPSDIAWQTAQPTKVSEPGWLQRLWDAAFNWLTGGNTVVRVGVVILFFGLAFLLKYSAEHALIPMPLRYFAVGTGAVVLLVFGWRLRQRRADYAIALQGGAIATLYLLCFSALRLHDLLPPAIALPCLIVIGFAAAALAVMQNAMALALIGQAGGFLAPILASSGGGSHVQLFSYYVLLNAVILAIAVHKKWRPLNVTGFIFTFGIGALWGGLKYSPEHYASTQPFLLIFFVMYVVISILFARQHEEPTWRPFSPSRIDGSLVFGVPLIGFGLQYALVKDWEFGAAFSALALAAFYVATAFAIKRFASLALLTESFIALATVFGSLAIPLALDAQWSSGSWAIEAAAIIWISLRQQQRWPRIFAYVLLSGAVVLALTAHLQQAFVATQHAPLIFTDLLLTSGFVAAWQFLHQYRERLYSYERFAATIALAFALIFFSWAIASTIDWYVPQRWQVAAIAFASSLTMTTLIVLQKLIDYRALFAHALARTWLWLLLLCAVIVAMLRWQYIDYQQPFNGIVLFNGIVVAAHLLYAAWFAQHRDDHWINRVLTHLPIWIAFLLLWRSCWLALAPEFVLYVSASKLLLIVSLVMLFVGAARTLRWPAMSFVSVVLLPSATLIVLQGMQHDLLHPLSQRMWLVWPLVFAAQLWLLRSERFISSAVLALQHGWQILLALMIVTWSSSWWLLQQTGENTAWPWLARLGVPAVLLLLLSSPSLRQRWPFAQWRAVYDLAVGGIVMALIMLQFVYSTISHDGNAAPLPYWPLINPLDLAHVLSLTALLLMIRSSELQRYLSDHQQLRAVYIVLATLIFVWLTCALLRAVHHYSGVPYQFDALWQAMTAQVALSLFWSALSLTLMMVATRHRSRWLWLCGAGLMAVVVLKLFVVDLSQVSGLQRVLSFVGVGVLMLIIGYLSPVPPKSAVREPL